METIQVQPYSWTIEDVDAKSTNAEEHVDIHVWALGRDSEQYLLRITDFPATCYIELPLYINGRHVSWSSIGAMKVFDWLCKVLRHHAPTGFGLQFKKGIYYYQGDKTRPMLLLTFNSLSAMKHCENLLNKPVQIDGVPGHITLRVWETRIPLERKLLTCKDSFFCQWINVEAERVEADFCISTTLNEFKVSWQNITSIPEEQTEEWMTYPGILAFDWEVNSGQINAFPNALNTKDCIFMGSVLFWKYRQVEETLQRYLLVYGECDPIEGINVITFKSEKELLYAFQRLVKELDPEILTGYNIFGFDWPYIANRLERRDWEWLNIGRLQHKQPKMGGQNWKSSGCGINVLKFLNMDGRISIDLLPMIKRDHKLRDYKLDTVSRHFEVDKAGKHDVTPKEMFITCSRMMEVTSKLKSGSDPQLELELVQLRKDMQRIGRYCDQDSYLVVQLFEVLNVWFASVELSNITGVSIMDTFTRGQQIRCISAIYHLAHQRNYVIDARDVPELPYEGGAVQNPIPGLHNNIPCFDVKSMYPSIIIADNMCHSSLVSPELDDQIPDENCHVYYVPIDSTKIGQVKSDGGEMELDYYREGNFEDENYESDDEDDEELEKKSKIINMKIKFVKKELHAGILPQIVDNYIKKRRAVQAKMKSVKDPVQKVILFQRQWALKICANSMYGFTGAQTGRLSLIEAAMCTTQRGRHIITQAKKYCEDNYGATTVYGDTDSIMPDFHIDDPIKAYEVANKVTLELSGLFPGITFELEKIMRIFCIKKKHYAAFLIGKDGVLKDNPNKMLVKGIPLARRDKTPYMVSIFKDMLVSILCMESITSIFDNLVDRIADIIEGKVNWEEMLMIRGLGSNYKNDSYFMKVFAEYLHSVGKPAHPGDRLEYIIVKSPEKLLGRRMRTGEMYMESLQSGEPMQIDIPYYINNLFQKSIDLLFQNGFIKQLKYMPDIGYKPNSAKHFVPVSFPVKIMARMLEDGQDVRSLKLWFKRCLEKSQNRHTESCVVEENKVEIIF